MRLNGIGLGGLMLAASLTLGGCIIIDAPYEQATMARRAPEFSAGVQDEDHTRDLLAPLATTDTADR